MDKVSYYLVLEKRVGDFNIIDINKLDICDRYYLNDIASIDLFTCRLTESDLKESIKRSNLVSDEYINGYFKIISNKHHRLPILTKEKYDLIRDFQNNDVEISKDFKNKLYGAYKKIAEKEFKDVDFRNSILKKFNETLNKGNKHEIFEWLERLPYESIRNFYFTIYKELNI